MEVNFNLPSGTSAEPNKKPQPTEDTLPYPVGEYLYLKRHEKVEVMTVSEQALIHAIDKANKEVQGRSLKFQYSVHEKTGDLIVRILDSDSNQVIREIPPEKFIDLIEKLKEITAGAIIDEKR